MTSLDEKLDEIFSIFVRGRHADYRGYGRCYTCPWIGQWREADCGHFIGRANEAVRWDKENGRLQCRDCNRLYNGRPEVFEEELRDELGDEEVEKLFERAKGSYPTEEEKRALLIHYQSLVKGLDIAV